ncbi:hypothetical protein TEA_026568 [Camellia sinensis var. sinensis]|uniref:Tafazzin family protein n=1 Tax=Camellia sinensis var. sinensis TaxID=542762 RepID=A0A4S4DML9_CAMSN|nr:hypothetical protein TEA_026568 [Camellia sinensis var. sinensis]
MGGRRGTMEWAARANHMGGIPRKMTFLAVGAFAKVVANILNTTTVHNADTLIHLLRSRPPGVPLLTLSNHMSTLDDPVMWGFKGFPIMDAKMARWVLAAEDICFKNRVLSYFFRLVFPRLSVQQICIRASAAHNKSHLAPPPPSPAISMPLVFPDPDSSDQLSTHHPQLFMFAYVVILHTFPEGKVSQRNEPIRRLKWGTASLIARAPVTPIVLPIVHHGFQEVVLLSVLNVGYCYSFSSSSPYVYKTNWNQVMPEDYLFGRRAPLPLFNKNINIIVGDPIEFDLPKLRENAVSMSKDLCSSSSGWPSTLGLNEAAQKCLYSSISKQIWMVMENLRSFGKMFLKSKG